MWKYTDEEVLRVVRESQSLAGVLRYLGLNPSSRGYDSLRKTLLRLNPDRSHWQHPKGVNAPLDPNQEVFVAGSRCYSSTLRKHVEKAGRLQKECAVCGLVEWLGRPITLQLDHRNGDRHDNRWENLRFLCPNCHSQTETWCRIKERRSKRAPKQCVCGRPMGWKAQKCRRCAALEHGARHMKIDWPPTEELIRMVEASSYVAIGKMLGVSNVAVAKRIKNHPAREAG